MKVENEFKSVIEKYPASCYFLACSGGVDSMVLLHLAKKSQLPIHVLHVNYNLRGIDSLNDSEFIEKYCLENHIPFSVHSVQLGAQLQEKGGNLQNEARKIRYDFFKKKLNEIEGSKLLTGQHLNDQIETFWLQLYRGSGMKGMAGMTIERDNIIRPLLSIEKKELIDYAIENKMEWREDASNQKLDYQRNKWRNEYLPNLRQTIPTIDEAVMLIQNVFQRNLELIDSVIGALEEQIKNEYLVSDQQINHLQLTELAELFRKLEIPVNMIVPFSKLLQSQKGARIEWQNAKKEKQEIIREKDGFYFQLSMNSDEMPRLHIEIIDELPKKFDKSTYYLDPKKINGEISIRKWQIGDRIYPIGLNGSKLISDVLTDAKTSNADRNNQFLICDAEKILACVGYCVDRRAIATNEKQILKISIQK